jgi:hypothetical protein
MKRLLAGVIAVSSILWAGAARAQTAPPLVTTTFIAVDAITVNHTTLTVTGVVEGEPEAATRELHFSFSDYSTSHPYEQRQSCERLALVAMSKPGMYAFVVRVSTTWNVEFPTCTLKRVTP